MGNLNNAQLEAYEAVVKGAGMCKDGMYTEDVMLEIMSIVDRLISLYEFRLFLGIGQLGDSDGAEKMPASNQARTVQNSMYPGLKEEDPRMYAALFPLEAAAAAADLPDPRDIRPGEALDYVEAARNIYALPPGEALRYIEAARNIYTLPKKEEQRLERVRNMWAMLA